MRFVLTIVAIGTLLSGIWNTFAGVWLGGPASQSFFGIFLLCVGCAILAASLLWEMN